MKISMITNPVLTSMETRIQESSIFETLITNDDDDKKLISQLVLKFRNFMVET